MAIELAASCYKFRGIHHHVLGIIRRLAASSLERRS